MSRTSKRNTKVDDEVPTAVAEAVPQQGMQATNSFGMMQVPQQQQQYGQPMMMQGQPMMMQGQPMMMQGQPMMMQGQPMMMQGQPMMMQGQPMMMQGQPMMMQGQPMMMQGGQPMMMQGQPMMMQGMMPQQGNQMNQFFNSVKQQTGELFASGNRFDPKKNGFNNGAAAGTYTPGQGYVAPAQQEMNKQSMPAVTLSELDAAAPFIALEGKEYLAIRQRVDYAEAALQQMGCESCEQINKYDIFDVLTGQPVYFAEESSDFLCRCCFAPNHEKTLNIIDVRPGMPRDQRVMVAHSPWRCNCCICFDFCKTRMDVKTMDGRVVSTSTQSCCGNFCTPTVDIKDRNGQDFATLRGGSCVVGGIVELCSDLDFLIHDNKNGRKGAPVSRVRKIKPSADAGAMAKEALTDADLYSIELPKGASNEEKAILIANALLMDYMFFEGGPTFQNKDNGCSCNVCNLYCCGRICDCHCSCENDDKKR